MPIKQPRAKIRGLETLHRRLGELYLRGPSSGESVHFPAAGAPPESNGFPESQFVCRIAGIPVIPRSRQYPGSDSDRANCRPDCSYRTTSKQKAWKVSPTVSADLWPRGACLPVRGSAWHRADPKAEGTALPSAEDSCAGAGVRDRSTGQSHPVEVA